MYNYEEESSDEEEEELYRKQLMDFDISKISQSHQT